MLRESGEKELILCNLLARRDAVLELGGLRRIALSQRRERTHGRVATARRQIDLRSGVDRVAASARNLGRLRADVADVWARTRRTIPRAADDGLRAEFRSAAFLRLFAGGAVFAEGFVVAAGAYVAAVLAQALALLPARRLAWAPLLMFLIFMSHVLYGLGFWRGCFTVLRPPQARVAGRGAAGEGLNDGDTCVEQRRGRQRRSPACQTLCGPIR